VESVSLSRDVTSLRRRIKSFFTHCSINLRRQKPIILNNSIRIEISYMTINKSDYPIRVHVVSDTLMKHELLIGADFLGTVQITMNAREVIINALKLIPEDKKIREMCQLSSNSEINNCREYNGIIYSLRDVEY